MEGEEAARELEKEGSPAREPRGGLGRLCPLPACRGRTSQAAAVTAAPGSAWLGRAAVEPTGAGQARFWGA